MMLIQLETSPILEEKIFLKKLESKKRGCFLRRFHFCFPIFYLIIMPGWTNLVQIHILMFPEKRSLSKLEQLMINGITGQLVTLNRLPWAFGWVIMIIVK